MLAQLVAVEPVADLDWLAGYLLLPDQQTQTIAQDVVEGRISVEELRSPAPRAQATAAPTSAPVALAPAGAAELAEAPAPASSPIDPTIVIVLLLFVGAAGVGGTMWSRRRKQRA